jgi:hypothetical protein
LTFEVKPAIIIYIAGCFATRNEVNILVFLQGDIVKYKFSQRGVEYFIVTDVYDFSEKGDKSDLHYEIMQIYPIAKTSITLDVEGDKLEIKASGMAKEAEGIIDFVMEERKKRGWTEVPDFTIALYENAKAKTEGNEVTKVKQPNTDIINYDKLESVDECLDALNDLDALYKLFGDEAYLQLRDVVLKRLKALKK